MINTIPQIKNTGSGNFFLIAGPCVIENGSLPLEIAGSVKKIADKYSIPYIFKASYKKANRSRIDSFTGIGDEKALNILNKIRNEIEVPVLTDIHSVPEADIAAKFVDVLQIPAFLCRQTDLLIAAAKTGKHINIKKGQFLSPGSLKFALDKVTGSGNKNVMLTERGTMFGYSDLVVDYRGIKDMQKLNVPVVLDVTHSLQQPNQVAGVSGGRPEMIETLARAGVASGVDGIFLETHPQLDKAKSDAANMLDLALLDELMYKLVKIRDVVKSMN